LGAGFFDGQALVGGHRFAIDASPEVEGAFFAVDDELVGEFDDEGVEVDDVAGDFVFAFEDAFEGVVSVGFDKEQSGVELALAGLLADDLGVADLVFVGEVVDGFFEVFVFGEELVEGSSGDEQARGEQAGQGGGAEQDDGGEAGDFALSA